MVEDNITPEIFQPAAQTVIADLETLRVISDPLRVRILEATVDHARTVKQIAAELHVPASKLYYHINTLEERGILRVVGTRVVSGIIEKQYQASARSFQIDRSLLSLGGDSANEALDLILSSVLDSTRLDIEDIQRAVEAGQLDLSEEAPPERKLLIVKTLSRLAPEQAAEFHRRLRALIREFNDMCAPDPMEQGYNLTILLHPTHKPVPDEDRTTDMSS